MPFFAHPFVAAAVLFGASLFFPAQSFAQSAETAPEKTQLGIGMAALTFPAYRGSDQRSTWILPVPYLEYRGEFFQADREGVRGKLFDSERLELSVSASGSPPTREGRIDRRSGMPGLRPALEVGPQLSVLLSAPQDKAMTLKLRLPVRQGVTLERQPRNTGVTFSPNLNLDFANPLGWTGGNLGLVAGPIFTSQKQNAYFYSVENQYAMPGRPAYQARSGYAGSQFLVSLSRKMGDWWVGSYVRYDNLQGAVFADSPLVATRHYVTAGFAVSYIFARF
jgi:MipA family protein